MRSGFCTASLTVPATGTTMKKEQGMEVTARKGGTMNARNAFFAATTAALAAAIAFSTAASAATEKRGPEKVKG